MYFSLDLGTKRPGSSSVDLPLPSTREYGTRRLLMRSRLFCPFRFEPTLSYLITENFRLSDMKKKPFFPPINARLKGLLLFE